MPRFDHHCPWVGNTIGYRNHPIFLAYTFSGGVCLIFGLHVELAFLSDRQHHDGQFGKTSYTAYLWVMLSVGILAFFTIFTSVLFVSQLSVTVLGNLTTNESMNYSRYSHFIDRTTGVPSKKSPFDRGRLQNIRMFFHFTAADEALCLQCDEPEVLMAA
eukprot:COSAG02_NODE_398_length_23118_cov_49.968939_15_plen_159_part_00